MFAFTAASSAATGYVPVFLTAKSSTANWKVCMFAFTLASRARSCMAMKFGIAIAARIPMITTTIISSIRVKPFWPLIMFEHLLPYRSSVTESSAFRHIAAHDQSNAYATPRLGSDLNDTLLRDHGLQRGMKWWWWVLGVQITQVARGRPSILQIARFNAQPHKLRPVLLHAHRGSLLHKPVGEELPIQGGWVDPEDLRRALLLPAGVVEHLEDILALQLVQGEVGIVD